MRSPKPEPNTRRLRFRRLRSSLGVVGAASLLASASPDPAAAQAASAVQYLPVCTVPNCLNPRVTSKSGMGSANASAEAKAVRDDAVAWCAQYSARNPNWQIVRPGA